MNRLHLLSLAAFMSVTLLLDISGQVGMTQTTTQPSNPTSTPIETNITDFDPNTFAHTFTHHTAYVNAIRLHYVRC